MIVKILAAFFLTFLFSTVFGKYYIPWLEKRNVRQPLKDEVAKLYKELSNDGNDKT